MKNKQRSRSQKSNKTIVEDVEVKRQNTMHVRFKLSKTSSIKLSDCIWDAACIRDGRREKERRLTSAFMRKCVR